MSDLELTMMRRVGELNKEVASLKAENARLKTEVEHLMVFCNCTLIPNKELQAQVERLTKAGDAMAAHIERNDERCYIVLPDGDIRISDWNAAKEGKGQP
jgi:regulator of replication initiation timing